jgi:hypothetical protein
MESCCLQYYFNPNPTTKPKVLKLDDVDCKKCGCHCGYIQYESLAPYMPQLTNKYTKDADHITTEIKLRQQIVEISRFFDRATNVEDGFYSTAHFDIKKIYGNGSRYLRVPDFIPNSLELYTQDGYLIDSKVYDYIDGSLVINPCQFHESNCGCNSSCGSYNRINSNIGWNGCYQIKAKFGSECSDKAVQMAVRAYLIEFNTFGDQKEATFQGYPVTRSFREPKIWTDLVKKYTEGKRLHSRFGFA